MKNRKYFGSLNTLMLFIMIMFTAFFYSCTEESLNTDAFLEIAEEDLNVAFLAEASMSIIKVKSNADKLALSKNEDWYTVEYEKLRGIITVTVSDNIALEPRVAEIKITNVNPQVTLKVTQLGVKPTIIIESKQLNVDYQEQNIQIDLLSNIDLNAESSVSWINGIGELKTIRIDPVKFSFGFNIDALNANDQRQGQIYFTQQEGQYKDSVLIVQRISTDDYIPGDFGSFELDKKINIIDAGLDPSYFYNVGEVINNTIDGDLRTIFHTPYAGITPNTPITLTYQLDAGTSVLNYIVLHPRMTEINGIIKSGSIEVKTVSGAEYVKVKDFNFGSGNASHVISLATPIVNPESVRIIVTDAYSGNEKYFVSLAEIECYESRSLGALEDDLRFFTDLSFSQLAPGVTIQDIPEIKNAFIKNIAVHLLGGTYPSEYRVQEYESYQDVFSLQKELKCSPYNQYENPTGIYFEKNENVIVFVDETNEEDVFLRVRDFGQSGEDYSYSLQKGVNVLSMKGKGNGYLSYYSRDAVSLPKIKVHIASGKVNGFFDTNIHSNDDGVQLLDNATSSIMDLRGKYVQLAYTVDALKSYSYEHLRELVEAYDSIVSHQYHILGFDKYNRIPRNRMLGRTTWIGYMYKDNYGAAFNEDQMASVAHYEKVRKFSWGPAHEFGHVNQVQPGMTWVGTSEVSNNIFSSYTQWKFDPENLRLEKEFSGGEIGGLFSFYFRNAMINNQEWGLQAGPEQAYGAIDNEWSGDVFVSLCPLWQLTVFFEFAGENTAWHRPGFWGDIFEKVRNTDQTGVSDGQLQINFVKNACDAAQMNLSDFFIKTGFLKEVDKYLSDYKSRQKTITSTMIIEAIEYAQQYPLPPSPVIYYISGNNYKTFRDKKSVEGNYGSGIGVEENIIRVNNDLWKNVVVFETYKGDKLTDITMVGTGSKENAFTKVLYPSGSTRIEAVGYDGAKTLVYGTK